MVDQQPQAGSASADGGSFADAMREVAQSLREVAAAIRESAAIVELIPCEDEDCGDGDDSGGESGGEPDEDQDDSSGGDTDDGIATAPVDDAPHDADFPGSSPGAYGPDGAVVLPLIPAQTRRETTPDATPDAIPAMTADGLCRPGGCGCAATPTDGQGRHARREAPPVPAGSSPDSGVATASAVATVSSAPAEGCSGGSSVDCSPSMCDSSAGI